MAPSTTKTGLFEAFAGGLTGALKLTPVEASKEKVTMRLSVGPEHRQPFGLVHGGVFCSMVETACSIGASLAVREGQTVVGVDNHTSFLKPVRDGQLTVTAEPVHVGQKSQLWEANITDDRGRLVATGRLRLLALSSSG